MSKIKIIQFHNYAAFYSSTTVPNVYTIQVNGQNLLLYGENGSGKSSVYKGVKDFFAAAANPQLTFNKNIRSVDNDGFIEITMDNNTQLKFAEDGTKPTDTWVSDTAKMQSFISYRELFQLLHNHKPNSTINLFGFLVDTLLSEYEIVTGASETIEDLWTQLQTTANVVKGYYAKVNEEDKGGPIQRRKVGEFDELLRLFNDGLYRLLTVDIQNKLNDMLHYFNQNISVQLVVKRIALVNKVWVNQEITLEVLQHGQMFDNYQYNLNEARLSALAISIYLAALKTNPTQNTYKILFLDDIFIGLDTSNRLPLLTILKEHFSDYQIFLTTYDRHWFEVAKQNLASGWLFKEMYVGTTEDLPQNFDYPLIQSSDDNYTKAKVYANRKKKEDGSDNEIDYPAAGNYLRKACEQTLKDLLYSKYKFFLNKDQETRLCEQLSNLWQSFKWLMEDIGIDINALSSNFGHLSNVVFNSLSHHNLHKPIYKTDIEKGFTFIDELRKIKKKLLSINTNTIRLQYNNPDGIHYYELTIEGELYVYKHDTISKLSSCKLSNCMHYSPTITGNPIPAENYTSIADAYQKIATFAPQQGQQVPILDYLDAVSYKDEADNWQPIRSLLESPIEQS